MTSRTVTGLSPNLRRAVQDKEDLRAITTKLQSLVEEKRRKDSLVKVLEGRIEIMERENKRRIKQIDMEWSKKYDDLRRLFDKNEDDLASKIATLKTAKDMSMDIETKYKASRRECDNYAKQLTKAEQQLADTRTENDKLQALVRQKDRDRKKQTEELANFGIELKKMTNLKVEAEDRLKASKEEAQSHLSRIEGLSRQLVAQADVQALRDAEMQKKFEKEKEDLRKSFQAKLDEFCKLKLAQYDSDKQNWMQIFRNEVETKMRGLRESNQSFQHTIKVMEDEAEVCRKELMDARATCASATSNEQKAIRYKEQLQREFNEHQEKSREKIEKLDRDVRRVSRDNAKMKTELTKKDTKLAELETEHCDYFAEITALQKVLATAEDTRSPSVPGSPMNGANPRKRKRAADDAASAAKVSRTKTSRKLRFSHVSLEERYIVIKNSNISTSLDGYYLTLQEKPNQRKGLPARTLRPNEELKVSIGKTDAVVDVMWEDFSPEGNEQLTCLLYDGNDEQIASYPYRPGSRDKCCIQ